MLEEMSSAEYSEWVAYFSVEPFPETRQDIRSAEVVQALIAHATQGQKVPKISELVPDWWDESAKRRPESPAIIQSKMRMVASTIKAKRARKTEK